MKKFICRVCGYVYEGEEAPEKCGSLGGGAMIGISPSLSAEVSRDLKNIAEAEQIPATYTTLESEEDIKKMNLLLEHLEDNDDVQNVYHNWDMPEE